MGVRSRFAALAAAQLILLAVCANASASAACPGDDVQLPSASAYDSAMALVCDINQVRAQNGLGALRWDWRLWSGAQEHADDMAARHYFGHITPEGLGLSDRIQPTGYIPNNPDWALSENLGFGTSTLSSPLATLTGWMNSAPHRENLLDSQMEDIGIGIARGALTSDGVLGTIFVADFGVRAADTSPKARAVAKPVRSRGTRDSVKSRWPNRSCSKAKRLSVRSARRTTRTRCSK
jgi:uncharacterized protein YkwD